MPCHNASHSHDWPRSGALSISKCEFKCGFCTSTKDYKPASALRKHVLTHIKNDKMPLTLTKSTGGRPKLQTTAIVSSNADQPVSPPSGSEITVTTKPMFGTSAAREDDIETTDSFLDWSERSFLQAYDRTPGQGETFIIETIRSRGGAGHFLFFPGSKEHLVQLALDHLKIHLIEIQSKDLFTWLEEESQKSQLWFWVQIQQCYKIAIQSIEWATGALQRLSSSTILYIFYATMITFVIKPIVLAPASTPGVLGPEVTNDGSSTTGSACLPYRPILLVLEEFNMNLCKIFGDVYGIYYHEDLRGIGGLPRNWNFIFVANVIPKSDPGITPVGKLKKLIDRLKSDHKLTGLFMDEA